MQPEFSDETLMAFADGALDEPQFSQVAEAIEVDHELASRLEALVTGSMLARRGYEAMLEPVSPELEAAVQKAIKKAGNKPAERISWFKWLYPIGVVGFASIALAIVVPSVLPGLSPTAELSGRDVASALDTLPSGDSRTLASGTVVHAIATFSDGQGRVCREFETTGAENYVAVSCRQDGAWSVQFALANAAGDENYRPASGHELLDNYLGSIDAGPPLGADEELKVLQSIAP